jgi:hypothetical protein
MMLDEIARTAREATLKFGHHLPTLIAEGDRKSFISQIEPLAETHEGRTLQLYLLGLALAESAEVGVLQQVFFISEAWLSTATHDAPPVVPPSRDPQRKEVLIVTRHQLRPPKDDALIFEMRRNEKGKLIGFETVHTHYSEQDTDFRSPLLDAFVISFLGSAPEPTD